MGFVVFRGIHPRKTSRNVFRYSLAQIVKPTLFIIEEKWKLR